MAAMYIRYKFMGQDLIDWNIQEYTGYKPISTYYSDFSIAERFGEKAIRDTYAQAKKYWFSDYKWLTEIVMILNWKIWEHYYGGNEKYGLLYNELWEEAKAYAEKNLKGEELSYYFSTTD